jgi:hypothetical protein
MDLEQYSKIITDEDYEKLEKFQINVISRLKSKYKKWIKIKSDLQDEYLKLHDEYNNTNFKNEIIKGIEQSRMNEYLTSSSRIGKEILRCGVFIEKLLKDDDSKNWLYNDSKNYTQKQRETLYLIVIEIFEDKKLYDDFINIMYKSVVLDDFKEFYNSFFNLLDTYTDFTFQTKSNYSTLLTKLLFNMDIPKQKKYDSLVSTHTKYGNKIQYKRKHKK